MNTTPEPTRLIGLPPQVSSQTRLLALGLGSFPSATSLARQQYYTHPKNAIWRILQAIWPSSNYETSVDSYQLSLPVYRLFSTARPAPVGVLSASWLPGKKWWGWHAYFDNSKSIPSFYRDTSPHLFDAKKLITRTHAKLSQPSVPTQTVQTNGEGETTTLGQFCGRLDYENIWRF